MTAKKRKFRSLAVAAAVLLALIIWIAWGNSALELNTYTINSPLLPDGFDGFRIAHVSDLHNTEIGKDNKKLLAMLQDAEPDIIAITGDLIDSRNTDVEVALQFIREAVKIAPCYYVTGNHESRISEYSVLKAGMETAGVVILEDARTEISLGGETITLIGVNDPSFRTNDLSGDSVTVMDAKLTQVHGDDNEFTILLSHRPELFDTYVKNNIDLVLSGHAHGGQFRLPFIGGLVAPHQGMFPQYDAGLYTEGNTNMIVSRGVGNSIFPFRINNRPEVLLIELQVN